MNRIIEVNTNNETVALLQTLVNIAIKAQQPNPSPVDIKLELAALNMHHLLQIAEDLAAVHAEHKYQTPKKESHV